MSESNFSSVRFLQLTDEDLRALGAVSAHWTLAEHFTNHLLSSLVTTNEGMKINMAPEESISFKRKTDNLKKLLSAACAQYPKHMEIGLALVTAGKELANERKIVAHWLASRHTRASDPKIQFAKMQLPPAPISAELSHWTTQELFDLADHIADWWTDLNKLWLALIIDGPLALQTTWHGQKPQDQTLEMDTFRTIGKNRRISTRGKRQRQP